MGQAQGEACRDMLGRIDQILLELAGVRGDGRLARGMGRMGPPVARAVGRLGRRAIEPHLRRVYPDQLERLRGIAAGAGLPEHLLFVAPAVELVLNRAAYTRPAPIAAPPGACTAVAVTGARSASGEAIIAKNFDYPPASSALHLTRVSRPRGRAASLEVTKAPLAGSHEGINEHGLAVSYNYGHFRGRAAARVSITFLVQQVLESCATVNEALDLIERSPRAGGALLMLADAGGDVASVELAPDLLSVRRGETLVHANHAATPAMIERDVPGDAVFPRWMRPAELRGRRVHASSERRHHRAEALVAALGAASAEELGRVLGDHGPGGRGDDLTICRHGPYYSTTCAVVLLPRRRAMRLLVGPPCEGRFADLSL
jgi:hypothetical protein